MRTVADAGEARSGAAQAAVDPKDGAVIALGEAIIVLVRAATRAGEGHGMMLESVPVSSLCESNSVIL
jgi:hypothetical protein